MKTNASPIDVSYKLDNSGKYELCAAKNFDWSIYYRGKAYENQTIVVDKDVFKILVSRIRADGYNVKGSKIK